MLNILIVEDHANTRKTMANLLRSNNYSVLECSNGREAIKQLETLTFDLILTDLLMKPIDGFTVLKRAQNIQPDIEVIVFTGVGSIENGVKAIKNGAFDFIEKPVQGDRLLHLTKIIENQRTLEQKITNLQKQLKGNKDLETIVGKSEPMMKVLNLINQVSLTDTTILITGESGTGKELVAEAIHNNSKRGNKEMVTINCGALPESLQESELFGHVKGSFTGAIKDKKGLFEEAHTSTVFLDEIGEMSPSAQVKLLRFLQNGEIRRVGDNRPINLDVRLIAATNKDLEQEVQENRFRKDLYYRLSVIPILLPPLRERREDIALLAHHFKNKYAKKLGKRVKDIPQKTMRILQQYDWPGNVRELENAIERALVLTTGAEILPKTLPEQILKRKNHHYRPELFAGMTLFDVEKQLITKAMRDCDNSIEKTSKMLGIDTSSLWVKLKEHNIISNLPTDVSAGAALPASDNFMVKSSSAKRKSKPGCSTILVDCGLTLSQLEEKYIRKVLERTSNKGEAAKRLGISQVTLWRKLKDYNIENLDGHDPEDSTLSSVRSESPTNESDNNFHEVSVYLQTAVEKGMTLQEIQKHHLMDMLEATNGKRKEAAIRLGISKATLWRKLKTLELPEPDMSSIY